MVVGEAMVDGRVLMLALLAVADLVSEATFAEAVMRKALKYTLGCHR